jgi:uncharacterized protein
MDADWEAKAEAYIAGVFAADSSGHDIWHSVRVYRTAMAICEEEKGADKDIVGAAALLHDVDDRKIGGDPIGQPKARYFLGCAHATDEETERILKVISEVPFKASGTLTPSTLEGKIVQDADRLDAIGAIGIARAFAYGGAHGRMIYNPLTKVNDDPTEEEYLSGSPDTISHFRQKLLKLKDMMNTEAGKRMAEHRHEVLEGFLAEFTAEWEGKRRGAKSL